MSSFFCFGNVSGKSAEVAGFYNDGKSGRINFKVTSLSGDAVQLAVEESDLDGQNRGQLGPVSTLNPGGQVDIAVNSVKGVLSLISGSGNTGQAFVRVDAGYLGTFGRGTLSHKERIAKTGFSGADIPR